MILLLSAGHYSDYGICGIYEGSREGFQAALREYRSECQKARREGNWHVDLPGIMQKYQCVQLEYEEVNLDTPSEIAGFAGLKKTNFMVKAGLQEELTVEAWDEEDAHLQAQSQIARKYGHRAEIKIQDIKELGT